MIQGSGRRLLRAAAVCALLAPAATAHAQYFGQNKVQYRHFDFRVLKTEHFDLHYYPEEREAAEIAARMAERWYARLSSVFDHDLRSRQPLVLYASHADFEQTNVISGDLGEGTGGVTEALKRRVVLPFAGPLEETDHVLGHEIVHAFQYDMTSQGGPGTVPGAERLPLWFIEGMAEYLSLGPVDPNTAMWMRDALKKGELPTVKKLDSARFFPYRYGQAFWAYVAGRWGERTLGQLLKQAGRGGDARRTLEAVLGEKEADISKEWHESLRKAYGPLLETKQMAAAVAKPLVTKKGGSGELNVGPAVSPDGQRLAFLSERGLFSIELYIADARTGAVRQRVVKAALDPHFESIQFISSAGAWDRTGTRVAFAAVSKAQPLVSVLDASRARVEREYPLPGVDEAFNPSWSPDGRRIVFSGMVGGLLDLFVLDAETGALRRLTHDAFAELHPAWSPDGSRIAFVTDRFSANLGTLTGGTYQIALLDPETGDVKGLPGFPGAKSINPQWSSDGQSLYFVSDRNGISNIYRTELAGGATFQVTDLLTGVSGITDLSPALSVAASSGRVVFCVYEQGRYEIYALEPGTAGGSAVLPETSRIAASLSPATSSGSGNEGRPQDRFPLPAATGFHDEDYTSKLTLDYVGQPYLGAGVDRQGAFLGGGTSFFFSDMLGERSLGAVLQVNGTFQDIGAALQYENRKHRFAWGASLEQYPYVTGSFSTATATVSGEPAYVEQLETFRQTSRGGSLYLAYPFSRASRFEIGAAYRNLSFSRRIDTDAFSLVTGEQIAHERQDLEAPSALNLGEASIALVHDSAVFGATAPIVGRRYRIEYAPTVGSIQYQDVLADVRQYVMPVRPYTLAGRMLFFGRYGGGAEDSRLLPLYLGYPSLVRGYDINSFTASECGGSQATCPVFDQLVGTRLLVANAELRFPPFGALGGRGFYGPLPLDLLAFADAGVAWTASQKARFTGGGGTRDFVRSVGFGARANLFGFAVAEVDLVRALDRPGRGWQWQFNFSPGF